LLIAALSYGVAATATWLSSQMVRSPLEGLQNQIVDLAFQIPSKNLDFKNVTLEDIVIIDIDDISIEKLGRPQLWPRAYDAYAISYVASGLPKSIGVDFLYTESDSLSPVYAEILEARGYTDGQNIVQALSTDQELARAIADAGNVYLSMFDDDSRKNDILDTSLWHELRFFKTKEEMANGFMEIDYPVLPIKDFLEPAKAAGTIEIPPMLDGTVRNYQLLQQFKRQGDTILLLANFPLYMAIDALGLEDSSVRISKNFVELGDSIAVPINKDGGFRINWMGKEDELRNISFYKILSGKIPAEFFENKYVFFGTSAAGLEDMKSAPFRDQLIPGVEMHAIALLNILNNAFIVEISEKKASGWFMMAALLLVVLFTIIKPFFGFVAMLILVFGEMFSFVLWFLPEKNAIFPIVTLILITIFAYLFSTLYVFFIRERRSRRLKQAFGSYVSPEVVEQIARESAELNLGGEKKDLTVLFSDIRGFTSYSERMDPQEIVSVLNDYLSTMSECIFKEKGTIDKFMGDAIMAIFGAPVGMDNHATRACRVALDMVKSLKQFNLRQVAQGKQPVDIGIGINSGFMTVGNIGSEKRFDYTVIGDEVNLASRLEGLTKFFSVDIIISQTTYTYSRRDDFLVRSLATVQVKGKDIPVDIYELIDVAGGSAIPQRGIRDWEIAMDSFRNSDLLKAKEHFMRYLELNPEDVPSRFYIERCEEGMQCPELFSPIVKMDTK